MDKLRQPSDDDRPSLNDLLTQAADLQQQYERDVEQANPYDAAERDLAEYCRKHRAVVTSLNVRLGGDLHNEFRVIVSSRGGLSVYDDNGSRVPRRISLDAPGDR